MCGRHRTGQVRGGEWKLRKRTGNSAEHDKRDQVRQQKDQGQTASTEKRPGELSQQLHPREVPAAGKDVADKQHQNSYGVEV